MKFEKYIMEQQGFVPRKIDENYAHIIDRIVRNCPIYLNMISRTPKGSYLFRGNKRRIEEIEEVSVRKDRVPKDMPEEIHLELDSMFKRKFGVRARSESAFVTPISKDAKEYGYVYLFFPIGKFKYIWSPKIKDLHIEIEYSVYGGEFDDAIYQYEYEDEYSEGEKGTWYYNGDDTNERNYEDAENVAIDWIGIDDYDNSKMVWNPEVSIEDFMEEKENEYNKERDDYFKDLMKGYTDKSFNSAIKNENEIMFICDKYYLVNFSLIQAMTNAIWG